MKEVLSRNASPFLSTEGSKSNVPVESIVDYAFSEGIVANNGPKRFIRSGKSFIARYKLVVFVFLHFKKKIHV